MRRPVRALMLTGAVAAAAASAVVCSNPARPSESTEAFDGVYRLRIETTCDAIPSSERMREYFATIRDGTATLSGATFWTHPGNGVLNTFSAAATETGLRINFTAGGYGVVERISPGTYLEVAGIATVRRKTQLRTAGRTELTGVMSGTIRYGQDLRGSGSFVSCADATLTFTGDEAAPPPAMVDPVITSITIGGPTEVAPGQSAPLQLIARLSDDSTREITQGVTWRTNRSSIVQISPTGVVSGGQNGVATISAAIGRANVNGLSTTRDIYTIPAGTFRLSGRITEAGAPDFPLGAVHVDVEDTGGRLTTLNAVTDTGGFYQLFGVTGVTHLRISLAGYQTLRTEITVESHATFNGELTLETPRRNLTTLRELTVTAATSCAAALPEALRRRTFTTTVVQSGPNLTITLTGARFLPDTQNHLQASVRANTIQLGALAGGPGYYGAYYYPTVVEQVSPTEFYSFDGGAQLTPSGDGFEGALSGRVLRLQRDAIFSRYTIAATCQAPNHHVELR